MLPAGCEAAAKPESTDPCGASPPWPFARANHVAHHEVERSERLASGTRTLYEVRPRA
jgi:hypothetical protein